MKMRHVVPVVGAVAVLMAGCAGLPSHTNHQLTRLDGAQEVPAVVTSAAGVTDIVVEPFKCPAAASSDNCPTIFGSVTTTGMMGTAAEIREGDPGQNGPVIVRLVKVDDQTWVVPADTTLTNAQYREYWAGHFYVDVDSAANPNGEIRGQLMR